jgi:uncharacterized membrane protein
VSDVIAYLTVFAAAATPWLEVLLVVPAGLLAGLSPVPTVAVAFVGNVATLAPVVLAGDRIRNRLDRRRDGGAPRGTRARRLLDRYGLPGLAVLGPLVSGAHLAALAATSAGAERRRTFAWLTAGIAAWAIVAALLTHLGVGALIDRESLPDLGLR